MHICGHTTRLVARISPIWIQSQVLNIKMGFILFSRKYSYIYKNKAFHTLLLCLDRIFCWSTPLSKDHLCVEVTRSNFRDVLCACSVYFRFGWICQVYHSSEACSHRWVAQALIYIFTYSFNLIFSPMNTLELSPIGLRQLARIAENDYYRTITWIGASSNVHIISGDHWSDAPYGLL